MSTTLTDEQHSKVRPEKCCPSLEVVLLQRQLLHKILPKDKPLYTLTSVTNPSNLKSSYDLTYIVSDKVV